MLQKYKQILGLSLAFSSPAIMAADYEINTFLSIGGAMTDADGAYLGQLGKHVSTEYDSKYGVNLRTQLNEDIEGAAQLLANGRDGIFDMEVEWAYVSYTLNDNLRIRIGKLNLQTFLLSDYVEVGYLYPWVRPPEEVYGFNPMRNFPGVEIMHISKFGETTLTSQLFMGSAQVQISPATRFRAQNGIGLNFQLDAPNYSLRLGGITPTVEIIQSASVNYTTNPATGAVSIDSTQANFSGGVLDEEDRMYMLTAGYTFDINNFIGYGEYIDVKALGETSRIFPNQRGYYVTFGYQFNQLLPYVTFAATSGQSNYAFLVNPSSPAYGFQPNPLVLQESVSLGLRYEVNDYSSIKFEVKNVDPTFDPAIVAAANSGMPVAPFNAGWSMGMGQTDDPFYVTSLTYDMIF